MNDLVINERRRWRDYTPAELALRVCMTSFQRIVRPRDVPHIFATDRESMFYAHGWAQMRNQANLEKRESF